MKLSFVSIVAIIASLFFASTSSAAPMAAKASLMGGAQAWSAHPASVLVLPEITIVGQAPRHAFKASVEENRAWVCGDFHGMDAGPVNARVSECRWVKR